MRAVKKINEIAAICKWRKNNEIAAICRWQNNEIAVIADSEKTMK